MKASIQTLIGMAFIALTACSTQEVKHDTKAIPAPDKVPAITEGSSQSGQNPPLTRIKDDKTLNLVRIMDGGACKNDFQGAKGTFLIYADPADIERIKREKGPQVFSDFENTIQTFATQALQEAINATNLAEDPFALGADEAQEKLAKQLFNNFRNSVADAIKLFQKETTLTVDVVPFTPSFIFYQQGCEATHLEPEN
ncbi:MAG: hypothetical protein Q8L79_02495 [Methylobacter sp.]|uniref:hypothetical protein n=1 Tax=Methylobacter sp. TaxID=2051955 RepID=UPI002731C003|nr:hypothetical protein [Methylobacter sp.]MDP1663967.1 hypothetical protein [Methylobacter sp.]MDP1971173.1 hypothetical protein [Methylobacter sp.]